jgi:hypothetical protein
MMFASTERPAFDPTPYSRWTAGVEHRIAPTSYAMLPNHIREHYAYTPRVGRDATPEARLLEENPLLVWFRKISRPGHRAAAADFVLSQYDATMTAVSIGVIQGGPMIAFTAAQSEHFHAVLGRLRRATWLDEAHA